MRTAFYYIVGDRTDGWFHAHNKKGWFHLNADKNSRKWNEGIIPPVGRRLTPKEIKAARLKVP